MDNGRKRWPFSHFGKVEPPPSVQEAYRDEPDETYWLAEIWSGERLSSLSRTIIAAPSLAVLRERAFAWLRHTHPLCFANVDFFAIGEGAGERGFSSFFQRKVAICYDVTFDAKEAERQALQAGSRRFSFPERRVRQRGRKKAEVSMGEEEHQRVRDTPLWYRRGWNGTKPPRFFERPEEAYANFVWYDLFVRPGPTQREEQAWASSSTPFIEKVQTLKWIPFDEESANLLLLRGWKPLRIWQEGFVFGHLERDAH